MLKFVKISFIVGLVLIASLTLAKLPVNAAVATTNPAPTGTAAGNTAGQATVTVPGIGTFSDIGTYVAQLIIKYGIPFAVAAALIMITYGGWHYIQTAGSPEGQKQAKELIVGALLGLVVLFLIGYALSIILPAEETTNIQTINPITTK